MIDILNIYKLYNYQIYNLYHFPKNPKKLPKISCVNKSLHFLCRFFSSFATHNNIELHSPLNNAPHIQMAPSLQETHRKIASHAR